MHSVAVVRRARAGTVGLLGVWIGGNLVAQEAMVEVVVRMAEGGGTGGRGAGGDVVAAACTLLATRQEAVLFPGSPGLVSRWAMERRARTSVWCG